MFVWDVATATTTRRLPGHMGKINAVEFNDDASVVASGECPSPLCQIYVVTYDIKDRLMLMSVFGTCGMCAAVGTFSYITLMRSTKQFAVKTADTDARRSP